MTSSRPQRFICLRKRHESEIAVVVSRVTVQA